jgi:hypothetical protein
VTKPFKQISSLMPIVETLNNTCEFDVTNSLHCHIGNVPTNKEFITKFYTLMVNIQDQVYKMFPNYKFTNVNKIKRKNYTQPLKSYKDFDSILTFLNNNSVCKHEYKGNYITHIADKTRTHKWDISSRYYWVNLIPLVFYPSRTIEFRIHQGTLNKYKIIYWLLMCMAMVKYAESDSTTSDKIDIREIFKFAYPEENTAEALILHYEDMCKYYSNYKEEEDLSYLKDTQDDASYEPKIKLF